MQALANFSPEAGSKWQGRAFAFNEFRNKDFEITKRKCNDD